MNSWKGTLNFGMIKIPVLLRSALTHGAFQFKLIDREDHSPIGHTFINKASGEQIPWERITRGVEYEKEKFVLLDGDRKVGNQYHGEKKDVMELEHFIEAHKVDTTLFKKPYYIVPLDLLEARTNYSLLRKALLKKGKVAMGKIILRDRPQLAAIIPLHGLLYLELLRFPREVKDLEREEPDFIKKIEDEASYGRKELEMAMDYIDRMSREWRPENYIDHYYENIMETVIGKIRQESVPPSRQQNIPEEKKKRRREKQQ